MRLEDLALVGNCQISALVERTGAIVWCCLPRFDSDPVFGALLDPAGGGSFRVSGAAGTPGTQRYLDNTNVVETTFRGQDGDFRVLDFAPRFIQYDRVFRPTQLFRIIEPLSGSPRIHVSCDPRHGWTRAVPRSLQGSNHVEYEGFASPLRLTTDIPPAHLDGRPFALHERRILALTWGSSIEEPLSPLSERLLAGTIDYWQRWVKHCNIPALYQKEVIRSALALKLHCFEDTGAIVASMTTSIPEAPGSRRNWDYRFCWLRDAFYALGAFRLLGHFEEREQFIRYLLNVAAATPGLDLSPLYRIDGTPGPEERIVEGWPGFEDNAPVRVGNAAAGHTQNDVFGEMVLALTPIFLDDRFSAERTRDAFDMIERLARKAISAAGHPDAGIWEYRNEWKPQTFTSLMCWAAADRMALVAARHLPALEAEFHSAAGRIREEVIARAWDADLKTFVAHYGARDLDASLLQMPVLRFLSPGDPRLRSTIDAIQKKLSRGGWLLRYSLDDGFGPPEVSFILCTFWLVEALAFTGRVEEATAVMQKVHAALSPLGLLSEDIDPAGGRMWGNFPQAYSHVGLIHAAFAAAPRWSDIL